MRKLPQPPHNVRPVFTLCIQQVRSNSLRRRLTQIIDDVELNENSYIQKALAEELHTFPRLPIIGDVTADELIKVYTGRFVPARSEARYIYDEIIMGAPQGRCPLCGIGQVTTLDHHLPKTKYSVLAVTPSNLIPACADCQKSKLHGFPLTAQEQTLHPYFDDFNDEKWLFADVVEGAPASFSFFIKRPLNWSDLDEARHHRHLETFKLYSLFSSNAANELVNIRYSLQRNYDAAGVVAVREHLAAEAESREHAHRNSWETAFYRAAADSSWFCDGGFSAM